MSSALIYIYLAGIAEKAFIAALVLFLMVFIVLYAYMESGRKASLKMIAAFLAVELFLGVFYIAFPSQTTFYTLAAAEVGKEIEASDTVQKAIDLINLKLDEALKEEKDKVK